MAEMFPRHTMVMPSPRAWAALMAQRPDLAGEPQVAAWAEEGRPLVVRRPACSDAAGTVPLGLPLPPVYGKRRIAVALDPEAVLRTDLPPLLSEGATSAPADWQAAIAHLLDLDPGTRLFGSLAWQHLTGLSYLSESSDLDLLWRVSPGTDVEVLLDGIAAIDRDAPMRIDGEVGMGGGAIQWRELRETSGEVAVKGQYGVRAIARADLFAEVTP